MRRFFYIYIAFLPKTFCHTDSQSSYRDHAIQVVKHFKLLTGFGNKSVPFVLLNKIELQHPLELTFYKRVQSYP